MSDPTVSQVLAEYHSDCALRGCRSMAPLRSDIATLNRRFASLHVDELNTRLLRTYQAERRGEGKAASTVNKELATLCAACRLAAENEIVDRVPKFPRRLKPAPPRQGFLEADDCEAIRRELPEWGRAVIQFGWYSGWRRNEVLTLSRSEVDLRGGWVRLHPGRSKNGETRAIPLHDFGLAAIEEGLRESNGSGLVFTRESQPISRTEFNRVWREGAERAGCGRFHFHDLRRSVVRRLELAGVPRKLAMAWVGHKTQAMYERYCITREADLVGVAHQMLRSMGAETTSGKVVAMFPRR